MRSMGGRFDVTIDGDLFKTTVMVETWSEE
jgi:hypothetical protein